MYDSALKEKPESPRHECNWQPIPGVKVMDGVSYTRRRCGNPTCEMTKLVEKAGEEPGKAHRTPDERPEAMDDFLKKAREAAREQGLAISGSGKPLEDGSYEMVFRVRFAEDQPQAIITRP